MRRIWSALSGVILFLAIVLAVTPLRADEPSFEHKNVTLIVSSDPGGGTDLMARLIGVALTKYLPGHPTMIYRIMAAAGGTAGLNFFYTQSPPDGLTFFIGAGNQLSPVVLRRKEILYDPARFELIGGFANPSGFLLALPNAVARLTDHAALPVHMGVLDGTRSGDLIAMWGAEGLGWNLALVAGYAGTSSMMIALQRGEVDMMSNNDLAVIGPVVREGWAVLVAQTGELSGGNLRPSSMFPSTPIFGDLARDKFTGVARAAFDIWERQAQIGKWFALPPGTPPPIVESYRRAFARAAADSEFLERATSVISPDLRSMSATDLQGIIHEMVHASDEALTFLDQLTTKLRR
jgi:tripartite-type tricarboxylate transporter receptor subunit TctC